MTPSSFARRARQLAACGAALFVLACVQPLFAQDRVPELPDLLQDAMPIEDIAPVIGVQDAVPPAPPQDIVPVAPPGPAPKGQTDVRDLWNEVRHRHVVTPPASAGAPLLSRKPFFAFAPTIGSKPSTGLTLGLGATVAFVNGDVATTHLSSVTAGMRVSFKEQAMAGMKVSSFTPDDRWFVQADNRLQWTSLGTYALGGGSPAATGARLNYDFFRIYETTYRQVAPRVFVGGGLNFNDHTNTNTEAPAPPIDQTAYAAYTARHGFDLDGQKSAGANVGALYDTRDNSINASRGWLVSGNFRTFFNGFLGGDSSWQELYTDVRTYRKLTKDGRQKLAFWFLGDLVTGGTAPYFDLPTTGGDMYGRSARGYSEGRYRGPHLLYGEIEYRGTITRNGLLGVVAFLNTTTVDNDAGQKLFQSFAPGRGVGGRVLLDKRSRTNLCIDYGWGRDGARGLYLSMQEAF